VTGSGFDLPENTKGSSDNRIEKRVWIKASAEVVYRALTDSKDLARWFCDSADCTPCIGGELIAYWKAGKTGQKGRAVFTVLVPNSSIGLLWIEDGGDIPTGSPKHTLSYTIESKSGMTEVTMLDHDETSLDQETIEFIDQGWNSVLLELKDFCERRERTAKLNAEFPPRPRKTFSE
jgi:uncharacterized protein YndB with AHSA1/START domain